MKGLLMEASSVLTDPGVEAQTVEQPVDPAPTPVDPPAPFPSPEAPGDGVPAVVEPDPCSITLVTGQKHDIMDVAEVERKLIPGDGLPTHWVRLVRSDGKSIVLRETAIIAYE